MPVDVLDIWKTTLKALPKTADNSWAGNFAAWTDDRTTSKMDLLIIDQFTFTFAKAIFEGALIGLGPTPSAVIGITAFANAWETAINASTVVVPAGASIGTPSPATTWSAVSSTIILAPSIALAKAKILELVTAPTVADALNSEFPIKFRDAFLLLQIQATGLDSTPPAAGPLPLVGVSGTQ